MRFIDEARLEIKAGNGGGGALSFRREPYVSKGGPDGGDGGNGGNVIFRASQHVGTLADLNHRYLIKAKNGAQGQGSKKNGRNAPDIFVDVPLGTIVYDHETDLIIADLIDEGQTVIIAKGGQGGRGNARFA